MAKKNDEWIKQSTGGKLHKWAEGDDISGTLQNFGMKPFLHAVLSDALVNGQKKGDYLVPCNFVQLEPILSYPFGTKIRIVDCGFVTAKVKGGKVRVFDLFTRGNVIPVKRSIFPEKSKKRKLKKQEKI